MISLLVYVSVNIFSSQDGLSILKASKVVSSSWCQRMSHSIIPGIYKLFSFILH